MSKPGKPLAFVTDYYDRWGNSIQLNWQRPRSFKIDLFNGDQIFSIYGIDNNWLNWGFWHYAWIALYGK